MANISGNHPYEPFIFSDTKKLIIGTIPPPRFCNIKKKLYPSDVDFYYGSRDNHFWDIMSEVFDTPLTRGTSTSILERKCLLQEHHIGICDILKNAERKKFNSSADKDLIVKNNDILNLEVLLQKFPNITTLIYTSNKVKSFIYQRTKREHRLKNGQRSICLNNIKEPYRVMILPSPSTRNASIPYEKKIEYFKNVLIELHPSG